MSEPLELLTGEAFEPGRAAGFESGFFGDWGVAIRLRGGCANRCVFCHGYREPAQPTPLADVRRLLDQAPSKRLFLYGEVLNHPSLLSVLDEARARGYERVELQAMGEELCDPALLDALIERQVRSVSFAIYAAGPLQDRLTGREGSWERIRRSIELLRARPSLQVFIHTVLTRANAAELGRLRALADAGGWSFWILPLDPKPEIPGIAKLQCRLSELTDRWRGSGLDLLSFPLCVVREVNPALYRQIVESGRDAREGWSRKVETRVSELTFGYTRIFKFVQPAKCGGCAVRLACPGVFQGYLDAFGDGELAPVEAA